jgi:hypothetical protein
LEELRRYARRIPPPPKLAPILNPEIDRLLHPLAEKNQAYILVDTILHYMVEMGDQFVESTYKALKYNFLGRVPPRRRPKEHVG